MSEQQPNLTALIPADEKRSESDTGAKQRDEAGKFKPFEPTDEQRSLVKGFAAVGLPQPQIATYLEIDKVTLLKYFRKELDTGMIEANSKIASTLYQKAISGNIAAAIFWAKARMGWSERVIHANDPDNPITQSRPPTVTIDDPELAARAYAELMQRQT